MASQSDADFPISSTPIVMLSPPDTQDVFHTPPEDSLLPSSDVDLSPCTLNRAVDIDAGSQALVELPAGSDNSEFVDFGKDSQLGFSQDSDSVSENRSHGFRVLEKGVSDFDESPMKKLKLGFHDSLGSCSGVQSEKFEDGIGKVENACKFGEDVLPQSNGVGGEDVEMQNLIPEENVEIEVVENAGDVNLIVGNNSNNEIGEDVLPQSNGVGGENVEMEKSIPDENVETEVVQNAGDVNLIVGNNSNNEIGEMENSIPDENVETEVVQNSGDDNGNNSNNEIGEMEKSIPDKKFETEVVQNAGDDNGNNSNNEIGEMEKSIPDKNVETEVVQNAGDDNGNNSNNEIGEMEKSIPDENVETEVVQNAGDVNGNNSNNEIGEGSLKREDLLEEETENGMGYVRSEKERRDLLFDVFRVIADHSKKVANETKGVTLLETAMRSGVTFPRPSWLPADRKSKLFKFDDEVKK